MANSGRQNVIDNLHFAIGGYLNDFWSMGFWIIPKSTNMAGVTSCIYYLGLTCLLRN
jgi:hypothetical protein